jgi:hypothetical protein
MVPPRDPGEQFPEITLDSQLMSVLERRSVH